MLGIVDTVDTFVTVVFQHPILVFVIVLAGNLPGCANLQDRCKPLAMSRSNSDCLLPQLQM